MDGQGLWGQRAVQPLPAQARRVALEAVCSNGSSVLAPARGLKCVTFPLWGLILSSEK